MTEVTKTRRTSMKGDGSKPKRIRRAVGRTVREAKDALAIESYSLTLLDQGGGEVQSDRPNRNRRGLRGFYDEQIEVTKRWAAENPKGHGKWTREFIADVIIKMYEDGKRIHALREGVRTAMERIKKHNDEGGVAQIEIKDLEELLEREESE